MKQESFLSIAMLTLDSGTLPSADGFRSAWLKTWPRDQALTIAGDGTDRLEASLAGAELIVALMGKPIPTSEPDPQMQRLRRQAGMPSVVPAHTHHAIITVVGDLAPVDGMVLLTKAAVALSAASEHVNGVFWCNSNQWHQREAFVSMVTAMLRDGLPIPLWVSQTISERSDGGSDAITRGMQAFGQPEIEAVAAPEKPEEMYDRISGLAEYLIRKGPVIKSGETFGTSGRERIRFVHGPSQLVEGATVSRLEYGQKSTSKADDDGDDTVMTTWGKIYAAIAAVISLLAGVALYVWLPYPQSPWLRAPLSLMLFIVVGLGLLFFSDAFLEEALGWKTYAKKDAGELESTK